VSTYNSENRYSNYAVWAELYRSISTDVKTNQSLYVSYRSPITVSGMDWMEKVGEAIKNNDNKTAFHYLWNIAHFTMEAIDNFDKGLLQEVSEDWMKPYFELNQAANILLVRLEQYSV
jgi:hypothetical protein